MRVFTKKLLTDPMNKRKILALLWLLFPVFVYAQNTVTEGDNDIVVSYERPQRYVIGGIEVAGMKYLSADQILSLSGLQVGQTVILPSMEVSDGLRRISMQQSYFSDIALYIDSLSARRDTAYLKLDLKQRPRVSRWSFRGVKSSEQSDLRDRMNLKRGTAVSEYMIRSNIGIIKDYYKEKGFLNAEVEVIQRRDSVISNAVQVTFDVNRHEKVKVRRITFEGNNNIEEGKLVGAMKKTSDRRLRSLFKPKKFIEEEYEKDKDLMLNVYSEAGYRDARIVKDSLYYLEPGRLGIHFVIDEGKRYYFRNITWTGNSLYTEEDLNSILQIKKGDIYDVVLLQKRLFGDGRKMEMDISSLYRDQGYLFFNITPVEVNIDQDSVDVELRLIEGKPATFNNIIISGNTITNERVVRRQLFTRPGYLYSQSLLERSIREISSMGHFDAEHAMDPSKGFSVIPNSKTNTVDIAYNVLEKPNSTLELSGGWGGYSFVGTVGVSFNNFSARRLFEKSAWRPVPLGDAQTLSFRFQTNGRYYTALSASFQEPWLFGKKPTSLNVTGYYSRQTNSFYFYQNTNEYFEVYGVAAGLGSRLKWPDNYFVLYHELSWQTYNLHDWNYNFLFSNGTSHNLSYKISLSRNSTDQMIYPREGSDFVLSAQLTPPYSAFRPADTDYKNMTDQQRYRWIEYHKWTFKGTLYTKIWDDLVLMTRAQFGYLGTYDRNLGYSPFEGYQVGGDGMSGYNTYGSEIIGLRGYENYSLTPLEDGVYAGRVYDKFTLELRYPLMLQPTSTIFFLAFLEGGNAWADIRDFNPFEIKRSAGVGVRIFLPMIGMLGIDLGYGFDHVNGTRGGWQPHFVLGQQF